MLSPLLAFAQSAVRYGHTADELELLSGRREAGRRWLDRWRIRSRSEPDLRQIDKLLVVRRRRRFGRWLARIGHALGWHSRKQKAATHSFIEAVHAHAGDAALANQLLTQAGVRPNRATSAAQVLRVVYRLEPEAVLRMQFSHLEGEASGAPRKWHYARQIVLKLKASLRF